MLLKRFFVILVFCINLHRREHMQPSKYNRTPLDASFPIEMPADCPEKTISLGAESKLSSSQNWVVIEIWLFFPSPTGTVSPKSARISTPFKSEKSTQP